jgi:hypothetical protein
MQFLKELGKIPNNVLLLSIFIILLQLYSFNFTFLGKLVTIISIIYVTINHKSLGLLLIIVSLFLNYKINENLDIMESKSSTMPSTSSHSSKISNENINTDSPSSDSNTLPQPKKTDPKDLELNDAISTFKKVHCKNGKILDKDGKEIQINDLNKYYPAIKFELENAKCNPCDSNCKFTLTSSSERLTVEEKLRPTSSSEISTN